MFNGDSAYDWNGNSFSDCSYMHIDSPIRPVAPWKYGISQAAMMRGQGAV
jgi:hypothetical protein